MNWPSTLVPYHRTPEFDESSVPAKLLEEHDTKEGVWVLLRVLEGALVFVDLGSGEEFAVDRTAPVFIEPNQPHRLQIDGPVRFYLEFFKDPSS